MCEEKKTLSKKTKKDINFRLCFVIIGCATNWWLRSPNASNSTNFYNVNNNGNSNNNNANNERGVCFDFLRYGQTK